MLLLKLVSKDHKLNLFSKLRISNQFEKGKYEFELKQVRKVRIRVFFSKVDFHRVVEFIHLNMKLKV